MLSKWVSALIAPIASTATRGSHPDTKSSTIGKPVTISRNPATPHRTNAITWFFVNAERNAPSASSVPERSAHARYPTRIAPWSGFPSQPTVIQSGTVSASAAHANAHAARNFPSTRSRTETGSVSRSSIVPVRRSSAQSRMLRAGTRKR